MTMLLEALAHHVRYACRGLRRTPGFTLTVTLTLALGIGANVAMFDVTDRLMFRPFPYLRDPSTVHRVYLRTTIRGKTNTQFTYPYTRVDDLRERAKSIAVSSAVTEWRLAVGEGDDAIERQVVGANAAFFDFFDAPPVRGRYFTPSEDQLPRGADVAVISYGYWMSELGGRDVIGQRLDVGPLSTTIIGVAPKGFVGVSEGEAPAVWLPITTLAYGVNQGDAQSFARKYIWDFTSMIVRRRPDVSVAATSADLTAAFIASREIQRASMPTTLPANLARPVAIAGPVKTAAGPSTDLESRTLLWVNGVALMVLLIACANVLNLMVGRVFARRREIAVRLALGVSRGRLAAQFIVEGLVLAGLGCIAGVVVAQLVWIAIGRMILRGAASGSLAGDWRALLAACGCAVIAGVVVSVGPALLAPRENVAATLRSGARQDGGGRPGRRVRAGLLVLQSAISVLLLVGAGLFVRSLANVRAVHLGWDPERVLVVTPNYRGVVLDSAQQTAVRRGLIDAAHAVPGVAGVTRVNSMPFATSYRQLYVDGIDSVSRLGRFNYQATTPEYFSVAGTRIVRGRGFDANDRGEAARVAVVSQSMARALWPGTDAIGRCFRIDADTMPCTRVIGVAEDAVQYSISDAERLLYYLPDEGPGLRSGNRLWLRIASGEPSARVELVRRALQRVMPAPGYVTVAPLEDIVDAQRRSWTLGAMLFLGFGGLALIVAAVGLYGVISYGVTQRMHELGIRIALGALPVDVVRLVVSQALGFASAGLAAGLGAALVAGQWVQPLLFGESARDPLVFAAVGAVILVVGLAASSYPALRATRADPNAALRAG